MKDKLSQKRFGVNYETLNSLAKELIDDIIQNKYEQSKIINTWNK